VLGKLAQFAKVPDIAADLQATRTPEDFLALIDKKSS
jgi:mannitol/fructose-specific phosphotransferase system IIA component (Ntr-type)